MRGKKLPPYSFFKQTTERVAPDAVTSPTTGPRNAFRKFTNVMVFGSVSSSEIGTFV